MEGGNGFPESLHFLRWRTYLWVLIASTIFFVGFSFEYIDKIVYCFKGINPTSAKSVLVLPSSFLIIAWIFWLMFFGVDLFFSRTSFFSDYRIREEDYRYITRKYSKYYRFFDMAIALFYLTMLFV